LSGAVDPRAFLGTRLGATAGEVERERLEAVPYYDGLMSGELDALVRSFAGEPVLHDPLRGRIKGARAFESYVRVMSRPHPPATSPKDRRRAAPSRGL
jgi:hypothetical protein